VNQKILTGSDETLAVSSGSTGEKEVEAFDYTLAWAQRAARKKDPDAASKGYFDAMLNGLKRTGWDVQHSEFFIHEIGQASYTGFSIVETTLYPYLGQDLQGAVTSVLGEKEQENTNLDEVCDPWWNMTQVSGDFTAMAIGVLYEHNRKLSVKLAHYCIHFMAGGWRSLYEERSGSRNERIETYRLTIELNMHRWQDKRDQIRKEVEKEAKDRINSMIIDV